MAKFKAGDAVKLRDDVEYGNEYGELMLLPEKAIKGKKYTVLHVGEYLQDEDTMPDYCILETRAWIGEDALEAWPESTTETMSNEIGANWFDATKVFPPFDKKVIGYYTIPATDGNGKKTGEFHEYYVIVMCESVSESSNGKSGLWRDSDYNTIDPLCWCELPQITKETLRLLREENKLPSAPNEENTEG